MAYREEEKKGPGEKKRGLRSIGQEMEAQCWQEDKERIKVNKQTLSRRLSGVRSQAEVNANRNSKFNDEEREAIISYAIQVARRGFPLSPRRVSDITNQILHARDGSDYEPVGKRWAGRFVEKHSDHLKTYWSNPLDHSRARSVNPTTKAEFYELLRTVIDGEGGEDIIAAECIYGADETGIQNGIGTVEQVVGPAGESIQHQQRSGDRENITVLVTICADGTSIAPAVIFKGETFQSSWKQDNPLNAS